MARNSRQHADLARISHLVGRRRLVGTAQRAGSQAEVTADSLALGPQRAEGYLAHVMTARRFEQLEQRHDLIEHRPATSVSVATSDV